MIFHNKYWSFCKHQQFTVMTMGDLTRDPALPQCSETRSLWVIAIIYI